MSIFSCFPIVLSSNEHRPRVYFTCHRDDFSKYFDKISEELLKTHKCTIFYTKNMDAEIEERYKESFLNDMSLFVIPVTTKLLSEPNRAMLSDFVFAKKNGIPVLPIVVEAGIDGLYSRSDRFDALQYLNSLEGDSYEKKLKKYLDTVLISKETVNRIYSAFDAQIFLSYRKKDWESVNSLLYQIHSFPEFQNVAIWYDEFLTPGENFNSNIESTIIQSQLFALLVTPSLLELVNGEPNYVMSNEYPLAPRKGMEILPIEMEKTDRDELLKRYPNLPHCIDAGDKEALRKALSDALPKTKSSTVTDPAEKEFLIGLAYLEGIGVKHNRKRGIELLNSAVGKGSLEAMRKLYDYYELQTNFYFMCAYAAIIADYCKKHYGENSQYYLTALNNLAYSYMTLGRNEISLEICEQLYDRQRKVFGKKDVGTLDVLHNLAFSYGECGRYKKAMQLGRTVYKLRCHVLGEKHPDTITSLNNLAVVYGYMGKNQKSLSLYKKVYQLRCLTLSPNHPESLVALNNLASTYDSLGERDTAIELYNECYDKRLKLLGPNHPDTLATRNNLASCYQNIDGREEEALEIYNVIHEQQGEIYCEEHNTVLAALQVLAHNNEYHEAVKHVENIFQLYKQDTSSKVFSGLTTMNNMAQCYEACGDFDNAVEMGEKALKFHELYLGFRHPDTLTTKNNLAYNYSQRNKGDDQEKALKIFNEVYPLQCNIIGKKHPHTLITLSNLARCYSLLNENDKAIKLGKKAYKGQKRVLGKKFHDTIETYDDISRSYSGLQNYKKALKISKRVYKLRLATQGLNNLCTIGTLNELGTYYSALNKHKEAVIRFEKAYNLLCDLTGEPDHPFALTIQNNIAVCYAAINKS